VTGRRPIAQRLAIRFRTEIAFAALVVVLFAGYLFSDDLLYGSDSIPSGLAFRGLLVDFVREFHELPRWNPYILGGLPFLDATHGDTFFPTSLLQFVLPVYRALGHKLILHVFLAGVFMAFYLRSLRLGEAATAAGALCYMLSPVLVSYIFAGQDGKMYVTSLAPLVLGLLERAMRSGSLRTFLGLGAIIGLLILSAQIQMAYHCLWFVGALFVLRLWRGPATGEPAPPRARSAGLFVLAVAVGVLLASIQLLPAVAYVKHPAAFSVRSEKTDYEHASSWSLHPEELGAMVVPDFCNAPVPAGYWGRNIFKYNSDYVGILTLFLAGLALARRRDATRWFLAGLAAFAVLYSLGGHTPLHRLFYAVVPQVKLFRAPPLVMFGAAFAFAALAAHAVHDLEAQSRAKDARRLASRVLTAGLAAAAVIAVVGMSAGGFLAFWTDLFHADLDEAKRQAQMLNAPAFRSGALVVAVVLAAGAGLLGARLRGGLSARVALGGLLLLTVVDLWRVDRWFIKVMEPDRWIRPAGIVADLAEESEREKFRVAPIAEGTNMNELSYFGIESTYGFHDNELRWYRELREAPESENLLAGGEHGYPFLRLLNVKYVLHDLPGYPNPLPVPGLPRFRLVERYEVVTDPSAMPVRIAEAGFDPERVVLLEEPPGYNNPPPDAAAGPPGRIPRYEYLGNRIRAEVEVERPCLLVHAENWFPYWSAWVDDGEARMLRAYGVVRAVPVPPGRHVVELRFRSGPFEAGKAVTGTTAALLAVFFVGGAARARLRR
jgi:hypothetical protein